MSDERCPQAGLVEALHDGRLGPAERASIERHVRTCAPCASLQRRLVEIGDAVRADVAPLSKLDHQRARLALLRAAVGAPPRATSRRPWAFAALVLVVGTAGAAVSLWPASSPRPVDPIGVAPSMTPSIASSNAARPLVGIGTPPDVTPSTPAEPAIDSGTTRPSARAPRVLDAPAKSAAATSPTPPPVDAPPPATVIAAVPPASDGAPPAVSAASRDFAAAMEALGSGDFGRAAARFAAFTSAYPFDPRSDDAAYLVAIALERAGRTADARAAAQRYLQSRPRGGHRAQAEKMVAPSTPSTSSSAAR